MMTGFEEILKKVPLESNARVLDVGAGGFTGETTTKYLVDRFDFVVAIERDPTRCMELREKFIPGKLAVLNTSLEIFEPLHKYDLMVIDLDEGQIDWIGRVALPAYGHNILAKDGYVITLSKEDTWLDRQWLNKIEYIPKWTGCHIGWTLLQKVS